MLRVCHTCSTSYRRSDPAHPKLRGQSKLAFSSQSRYSAPSAEAAWAAAAQTAAEEEAAANGDDDEEDEDQDPRAMQVAERRRLEAAVARYALFVRRVVFALCGEDIGQHFINKTTCTMVRFQTV